MVLLEYVDALFVYAMALTRNSFDAEDLVQKTYVRALAAAGSLHENSNLKAWLCTILRNIWLNQIRQHRAAPKFVEIDADENSVDLLVETAQDPHAAYVTKCETAQVREALRQLPEEFREIIVLREFADLSYREIASLLGCAIGTVMSRLSRGRSKLGALLSSKPTFPKTKKSARRAEDKECFVGGYETKFLSTPALRDNLRTKRSSRAYLDTTQRLQGGLLKSKEASNLNVMDILGKPAETLKVQTR